MLIFILLNKKEKLIEKKELILNGLESFHKQNEVFKGRDTNKTKVVERIKVLSEYFNGFIHE